MSFAASSLQQSGMSGMPKVLCIAGMVVAVLVAILFILDLAVPTMMFRRASILMDIVMIICALALGVVSWLTLKEQK
jgi:protein-S-isoprenylcysteine O-methyltransferase Ste14